MPAGNRLFLVRHAVGTQDYICLPSAGDVGKQAFVRYTADYLFYESDG